MMLDLAMGNDGSAYAWIGDHSSTSSSSYYRVASHNDVPRRHNNQQRLSADPSLSIYIVYLLALLSWASALYLSGQSQSQFTSLHSSHVTLQHQYKSQLASIKDVKAKLREAKSTIDTLRKTREALHHELQVIRELEEGAEAVTPKPSNRALVDKWLNQRQDGLKRRMESLQSYVQSFSKQQVLERWGEGPHQVVFTIEYKNDQAETSTRQVIVELASVHHMPHSVHFFLEMVEVGIWDHTVMLHHENIEHLIAAVPIDFRQQQFKHSHLAYLGWTKLGFPEYHDNYKHDKYSLGFANSGPTWYWNTVNNANAHGPGGQSSQKVFEQDADPCFARVIQGHDIVDDLIEFGLHQHQVEFEQGHPWADEPHTWTHLIKAEILHPILATAS